MAKTTRKGRAGRSPKKAYAHSAYWYATKYGWTASDATTYTQRYFDDVYHGFAGGLTMSGRLCADPVMVGIYMAVDLVAAIGRRIRESVVDPIRSGELRERLRRDYHRFRRPAYYARETARRHALMDARRKIRRRTTTATMPTPEAVRAAWENRRASKAAKILLGGMLHDLECYVDNRLRLDGSGNIVGRNHGIKGWIAENLSDLLPHYKALMYYKELAMKLRQATDTRDPTPTAALLPADGNFSRISGQGETRVSEGAGEIGRWGEGRDLAAFRNAAGGGRMHAVVGEIFADPRRTATAILEILDHHLSPKEVFTAYPRILPVFDRNSS